jgi:flagellar basal-body rod protein FlgB
METGWLRSSTIPALEQTAAFSQKRHLLLAGNIANNDVPDYRTRDISVTNFQEALQESINAANAPQPISPGSLAQRPGSSVQAFEKVRDVSNQVLYLDGNDVSLEQQVTEMSKNQSLHDMAVALMRSQFRTLNAAITESVNV